MKVKTLTEYLDIQTLPVPENSVQVGTEYAYGSLYEYIHGSIPEIQTPNAVLRQQGFKLAMTTGKRLRWSRGKRAEFRYPGSNPAEDVGFFGRKNPQRAFLRRESKAVGPMS